MKVEEVTLTWFGHSMFLAEAPGLKLVTDPFDEKVGYPLPEVEADVVLVSHDHFDHSNVSLVKNARQVVRETAPLFIESVKIEGCRSYHDEVKGQKRGENIVFKWHMSGVTFAHMGDYGETGLTDSQRQFLSDIDVLMIPVGGVYTIGCQKALEIVKIIRPAIVIPMHYKTRHCRIEIDDAGDFVSPFEDITFCTSSVVISAAKLPPATMVWVL